jgi:hypothetical protein
MDKDPLRLFLSTLEKLDAQLLHNYTWSTWPSDENGGGPGVRLKKQQQKKKV